MRAFILLAVAAVCAAEANPYYMIQTASIGSPAVPTGLTDEEYRSWTEALPSAQTSAWSSWQTAHASELSAAQLAIEHFAASASDRYSIPTRVLDPMPYNVEYTTPPEWFTALPDEIQRIKLAEGNAYKSIIEAKSEGMAPKETGRAALGVLAGVAVAAAVL